MKGIKAEKKQKNIRNKESKEIARDIVDRRGQTCGTASRRSEDQPRVP